MPGSADLLLVEDNATLRLVYRTVLERAGHAVRESTSRAEAMQALGNARPDAALLDLGLPDADGLEVMREMLAVAPGLPVVVITANGSVPRAVAAMRSGAQEFLVKPFSEQRLLQSVENALLHAPKTPCSAGAGSPPDSFIGTSNPMRSVYARIASVARSSAPVFITGESGTGKSLCAEAIHRASSRADRPFITVRCGAMSAETLDSALFGHLQGALPGANGDRIGAIEAADGGTLFLDEVCELDRTLQAKLEGFLQTDRIEPMGACQPRQVDVRIICASQTDPHAALRAGDLRPDLFYRLHVVAIHMPPLRERLGDVVAIAEGLLQRVAASEGRRFSGIAPEAAQALASHSWPGNVRQLINVLRNVAILHDGPILNRDMLPEDLLRESEGGAGGCAQDMQGDVARTHAIPSLDEALAAFSGLTLEQVERLTIEATIARLGGSVPRAALMLGVSPSTLYRKIAAWNAASGTATSHPGG